MTNWSFYTETSRARFRAVKKIQIHKSESKQSAKFKYVTLQGLFKDRFAVKFQRNLCNLNGDKGTMRRF